VRDGSGEGSAEGGEGGRLGLWGGTGSSLRMCLRDMEKGEEGVLDLVGCWAGHDSSSGAGASTGREVTKREGGLALSLARVLAGQETASGGAARQEIRLSAGGDGKRCYARPPCDLLRILLYFAFSRQTVPVLVIHNYYASSGYNINSGRTFSSNSSGVKNPSATVASFNVVPSLCAFFAHFATSIKNFSINPNATDTHLNAHCHIQGGCSES
jgi:hypothetical protein